MASLGSWPTSCSASELSPELGPAGTGDDPPQALGSGLQALLGVLSLVQSDLQGPGEKEQRRGALVGGPPQGGLAVAVVGLSRGGSELGPGVALQQSTHVQECVLQVVRQADSVGLGTAVVGRHGEVDVGLHGVIADTIAVWDHGPKEHDTVCLGRDLGTAQDQGSHVYPAGYPQPHGSSAPTVLCLRCPVLFSSNLVTRAHPLGAVLVSSLCGAFLDLPAGGFNCSLPGTPWTPQHFLGGVVTSPWGRASDLSLMCPVPSTGWHRSHIPSCLTSE